jgi:hypothetical protein
LLYPGLFRELHIFLNFIAVISDYEKKNIFSFNSYFLW